MGVFRTHIWDTQLLHCQAALVLLTLTLPFLQVTSLRGGPTRVGFFGDEYKQRKIGSLSIMLECGHRNYRKLDILYTNSSWFQWCFPVLIEKVCNNIGYNANISLKGFHVLQLIAAAMWVFFGFNSVNSIGICWNKKFLRHWPLNLWGFRNWNFPWNV